MEKSGSLKIYDGTLEWTYSQFNSQVTYTWENVLLGRVNINLYDVYAIPMNVRLIDGTHFNTFDEAHNYMINVLSENIVNLRKLKEDFAHSEERKLKAKLEYNEKFHHLDLNDVKAESEIYFTDLPSTRLMNVIKAMNAITLSDISSISKEDFLNYRNCGKKVEEEVETMFRIAGIWWHKTKVINNKLSQFSNEELIDECLRRGLKINL